MGEQVLRVQTRAFDALPRQVLGTAEHDVEHGQSLGARAREARA
jgi:hypothetical protein